MEEVAPDVGARYPRRQVAFYHGGEPIRVIRPFLEGEVEKPFLLAMTAAGQSALNVQGLGPVSGAVVRVAGLHGGGLSQETTDGWRVERLTLEWPIESVLLFTPGSRIFNVLSGQAHEFTKIFEESGVIACGFSPSGSTLLLATADEITIYRRELVDNH